MNNRSWMDPEPPLRSASSRKPSRRPRVETLLGAAVVLAWGWGIYELTLLFAR
jgi:hypothetical protein